MNRTGAAPAGDSGDRRAIATLDGVVRVFRNTTSWYNNASFIVPLLATVAVGLAGAVTRRGGVLGFAAFLAAVTLLMLPVVLLTWRRTATAVVVTETGIVSLHGGRTLKSLRWGDVQAVRQRETQGNVRWEIATASGDRLLIDGELEDLDELLRLARRLAGLSAEG